MENEEDKFENVLELEPSNLAMLSEQPEEQVDAASHRSDEPVSRITSYATAGVPTAIEP